MDGDANPATTHGEHDGLLTCWIADRNSAIAIQQTAIQQIEIQQTAIQQIEIQQTAIQQTTILSRRGRRLQPDPTW
jgi:hypothetical protein